MLSDNILQAYRFAAQQDSSEQKSLRNGFKILGIYDSAGILL
jgi:hypothetical protein